MSTPVCWSIVHFALTSVGSVSKIIRAMFTV